MNNQQQPPIDCYRVLGVAKDAEPSEIKVAFRKLAQKLHPDNLETGDEAAYVLMQTAYDVIGNPIKRKHYDETGLTVMFPPVEERVDDALSSLVNQVLMKVLTGTELDLTVDVLQLCRERVANDTRMLSITDQGLYQAIELVGMMHDRITSTAGKNVFEEVLAEKIRRMTYQVNINKDTHELFNALEKRLDLYSDSAMLLQ